MTETVGLVGATGRVGGWVLEMCLAKGYDVVALVRSPDKLKEYENKTNLTIVKGDATTEEGIEALIKNDRKKPDVIISTIGSPSKENLVVKKSAEAMVNVLKSLSSIPRLVWMTSTGINEATDQAKSYPMIGKPSQWCFGYGAFGWLQFKVIIPYVIGQDLWNDMGFSEDVIRADEAISSKTVIVRPGNMAPVSEHPTFSQEWRDEGGDNLTYKLVNHDDPPPGAWINRRAIATALIDLVNDHSHDGTAKSLFQ
mmetsp:Transcript_26264/g.39361  ORF Transcript_26264/g.39361 Transcript_26264/m.39361 type:complete len:254 (+) Transcript_26264:8-769(+)